MRWRRTTFGALLVIAVTGLVVPTAASPASEAKPTRKTFSVRVATPVAGDANLAVVTFRGRLVGRPTLRAPRRLSPGVLAVAATRRLSGGRTQVWFGVLRRGPGAAARKLASTAGASQADGVRFEIRSEVRLPPNVRTNRYADVFQWEDQPLSACGANPQAIASWGAVQAVILLELLLRAVCDQMLAPALARQFGLPHTDFNARLLSPNQIRFSGTISALSTAILIKHLVAGTYSLLGADAPRCAPGVQGTTHFVRCNVRKPAGATLDLILVYRDVIIPLAAIALMEAGMFNEDGDFYGPYPLEQF